MLFEDRSRAEAFGAVADLYDRVQDLGVREFPWQRTYTTDEWLGFLRTHSDHQVLAGPHLERLLAAVGEAIEGLGGSFEVEYQAVLVSARRT